MAAAPHREISKELSALGEADELLSRLRLLFRMSFEMQFINFASYEFGSR
jgi:hypothetical protein